MRIQVLFLVFMSPISALGACFDFSAPVTKPLVEVTDKKQHGKKEGSGITWATTNDTIEKPIRKVLDLLLDHETTKSPKVDEMTVDLSTSPGYLARHRVKFLIKPFLFVKIRWSEEWGYVVTKGTPEQPSEVVISYEKTEGTDHIKHLCGSLVLRKLGENSTQLFQYEEAKATQRSPEDTLNGLVGTVKTLREK